MFDAKKLALFLGGVVFGSAGFKVLSSKDAKKVYTQTTAAVLRMKDCTMQTVNKVQEEAGDILADAKAINESRAAEAAQEVIEDTAEQPAEQRQVQPRYRQQVRHSRCAEGLLYGIVQAAFICQQHGGFHAVQLPGQPAAQDSAPPLAQPVQRKARRTACRKGLVAAQVLSLIHI